MPRNKRSSIACESYPTLDDPRVWSEVEQIAAALVQTSRVRPGARVDATIRVDSDGQHLRYDARSTVMAGRGGCPEVVVVAIERKPAEVPGEAELRLRFGLTPQQARIARLLAARLTNREIAAVMVKAEATIRRHTEGVLRKLGVGHRHQVLDQLLAGTGSATLNAQAETELLMRTRREPVRPLSGSTPFLTVAAARSA